MSSIREQILAEIKTALTGTLPGAIPVYRALADALSRGDVPAVNIKSDEEETLPLFDTGEISHLTVHIEIVVRGDVWETLADPIILAAHSLLLNDATLAGLCSKLRRTAAKWEAHEADETAGVLTQTYRLQYRTLTNQM
jgi:hypothetical protein